MFGHIQQMGRNKYITGAMLLVFMSMLFVSLFHMSVDMVNDTSGCPFMAHEETLCSMSIFGHLGAWEANFLATVPAFMVLLGTLVAAAVLLSVAPHLIFSRSRLYTQSFVINKNRDIYSFPRRPLQELFSNGILHPKLF